MAVKRSKKRHLAEKMITPEERKRFHVKHGLGNSVYDSAQWEERREAKARKQA